MTKEELETLFEAERKRPFWIALVEGAKMAVAKAKRLTKSESFEEAWKGISVDQRKKLEKFKG